LHCYQHRKFVDKIKAIHGDNIKIAGHYLAKDKPLEYKCSRGHQWISPQAEYMLYNKNCPQCSKSSRSQRARKSHLYADRIKEIFGDKITVVGEHISNRRKLLHCCKKHGEFSVAPTTLLYAPNTGYKRYGCPKCVSVGKSKSRRITKEVAIARIQKHHGDNITLMSKYISISKHGKFKCHKGHKWDAQIWTVAHGHGCPICEGVHQHSKAGLEFIKQITNNQPHIRHAKHPDGEFQLRGKSGKFYRVDGYDPKLNIVYEFHGDTWHGNPQVFKPHEKCHPFSNLTAKELHRKTKRREQDIIAAGYTLIVAWEHNFKLNKAHSIELHSLH
jgi:hypothetical protein